MRYRCYSFLYYTFLFFWFARTPFMVWDTWNEIIKSHEKVFASPIYLKWRSFATLFPNVPCLHTSTHLWIEKIIQYDIFISSTDKSNLLEIVRTAICYYENHTYFVTQMGDIVHPVIENILTIPDNIHFNGSLVLYKPLKWSSLYDTQLRLTQYNYELQLLERTICNDLRKNSLVGFWNTLKEIYELVWFGSISSIAPLGTFLKRIKKMKDSIMYGLKITKNAIRMLTDLPDFFIFLDMIWIEIRRILYQILFHVVPGIMAWVSDMYIVHRYRT